MNLIGRHRPTNGFSLIELLIVIAIILIILGIAIPHLQTNRLNAVEMAVLGEIRTIHEAQTQYMSQFGKYASTLQQLGPGPEAADLIPASLASGEKDGYLFTLTPTPGGYNINANPKVFNSTGRRTFFSNERMTIHQNWSAEPASANSEQIK